MPLKRTSLGGRMHMIRGDIWEEAKKGVLVVIPTNIGWRKDGSNVMGAGLAKQAQERIPHLARWYGMLCKSCREHTPVCVFPDAPIILFPVKKLDPAHPHLSWKQDADPRLIERSLKQLGSITLHKPVVIPAVGCGNGNLSAKTIVPVMEQLLDDRFTYVEFP